MANEFNWFKFNITAWMMGRIQREKDKVIVSFLRLCCQYWKNECVMSLEDAELECGQKEFEILKNKKIISISENIINVKFLDEQWSNILESKKKASKAGQASVLARREKKQNLTPVERPLKNVQTDFNREEENRTDNKDKDKAFDTLLLIIKTKLGKNFKSKKEASNFSARLSEGFTIEQFEQAIINIKNDPYHIETGYKHITPEFVCRIDKLEKFINAGLGTSKKELVNYDFNNLYKTD